MKKFKSTLGLFLSGFFLVFLMHQTQRCELFFPDPGVIIEDEFVDIQAIQQGATTVESAFESGDVQQVQAVMSDDALGIYGEVLADLSADDLKIVAEVMKNRELTVASSLYAEFSFTENGEAYTFSLARQEDDSWKLVRF